MLTLATDVQDAIALVLAEPGGEPGPWPPAPLPAPVTPQCTPPPSDAAGDPTDLGVTALVAAFARGTLTPTNTLDALLARINRHEPMLDAWVALDTERARIAAQTATDELQRGVTRGPLHGVPVGVKDIFDVAGLPTRANSRARADAPAADADAESVARLRAAGTLLLGKTATTEFAYADPSTARNPWNPAHTPGGSSSGSAVAVAARMVPAALGTQTAGSVLRPAAFCGVVGFKPTVGRVSRAGVLPLAWSLDHVGTLTRSTADAALLYRVLAGAAMSSATSGPPRLGFAGDFLANVTNAATRDALTSAATRFTDAGASVEQVSLDGLGLLALAAHQVIMAAEVSAYHMQTHADHLDLLGVRLQALVRVGELVPVRALLQAQAVRRRLFDRWNAVLARYDAIVVPAAPGVAPLGLERTGDPALNAPWSLLGVPAISLPLTLTEGGLPLGLQLVSAYGEDAQLLGVAAWCEAVLGFTAKPGR